MEISINRQIGSDPSLSNENEHAIHNMKVKLPNSIQASLSDTDLDSTMTPKDSIDNISTSTDSLDEEEVLKRRLSLYNTLQNSQDVMQVSMIANVAIEHHNLLSTMQTVPLEVEQLKDDLSYYQYKLYQKFSVKLTDLVRLETLGKGAFGEVTRVFSKMDRQFYALKEIKRSSFLKPIYFETAVWTEVQNLLKVTRLDDSSLLKTVLIDFDENEDVCYMLMEFGSGTLEEFAECMSKYEIPWAENQLEYILSQLIDQVLKLKAIGMYHRDIKPSNVIICYQQNMLKLSDLGCACIIDPGVQKLNITGTPHFMSPELIQAVMRRQVIVDHDPFLSDLYSIGVTILMLMDPTLKRKDFMNFMETTVKERYPNLYWILRDLLSSPEKRKLGIDKTRNLNLSVRNYLELRSATVGDKYKLYLYSKIVSKNKNIDTSFYFDMFILDDALLVIQKQIYLLNQQMKPGDQSLEEVSWRIRLARCYYMQLKYEEALKELNHILQRNELKSFEISNVLVKAKALLWAGTVNAKLGRMDVAIDDLKHCLGIRVAEFGEVHRDVSAVFWHLGETYVNQDNCYGAIKAFEKCIEIGAKLPANERMYVAKSYNYIGLLCEAKEDYPKALEYFEKAKETAISVHGEHHPAVADQYLSIAYTYTMLGRLDEANEFCENGIAMKVRWYGENNPEVASAYDRVARVYEKQGEFKKVLEVLSKSVKIWKTVSGDDSQELADVYQLIGNALCKRGQYQKGLEYADQVIRILEKNLGELNPRLAVTYVWHAETCQMLGYQHEMSESLKKFLSIDYEKLDQNITSIRTGFKASRLLAEEGNIEKAWDYTQKAFQMVRDLSLPRTSKMYSRYHEAVARLRKAEGKAQIALENVIQALNTTNKIPCKEYDVGYGLFTLMGDLYEELGDNEKTLEWRNKSVEMVEQHLSRGSILMVAALIGLTRVLDKLGKKEEAREKFQDAKVLLEKLGIEKCHPIIQSYLEVERRLNGGK